MRRYRCDDCGREFEVPEDSPRAINGVDETNDFLTCPWCEDIAREIAPGDSE